jgi:hypothetical protein
MFLAAARSRTWTRSGNISRKTTLTPPIAGWANCLMRLNAWGKALGHKRADLTPLPLLFWAVGMYLIIYRAERSQVEIVAVTQGSRDIPAFLQRRVPWGE